MRTGELVRPAVVLLIGTFLGAIGTTTCFFASGWQSESECRNTVLHERAMSEVATGATALETSEEPYDAMDARQRAAHSGLTPCKKECIYGEAYDVKAEAARFTCKEKGDKSEACKDAFGELFDQQDGCWRTCEMREEAGAE